MRQPQASAGFFRLRRHRRGEHGQTRRLPETKPDHAPSAVGARAAVEPLSLALSLHNSVGPDDAGPHNNINYSVRALAAAARSGRTAHHGRASDISDAIRAVRRAVTGRRRHAVMRERVSAAERITSRFVRRGRRALSNSSQRGATRRRGSRPNSIDRRTGPRNQLRSHTDTLERVVAAKPSGDGTKQLCHGSVWSDAARALPAHAA
jgi:hypothetical protein